MSAINSNLSEAGYIYDLVTAVTQATLNQTLQQVLTDIGNLSVPINAYYKQDDATLLPILMTPEEVAKYIGDIDIFSIPDGATPQTDSTLNQIYEWDITFSGAIQATLGVPGTTIAQLQNAPDIITLQTTSQVDNSQTVIYSAYFKTYQVMELSYNKSSCVCHQYAQSDDSPYLFQSVIDLKLNTSQSSFADLPAYMQSSIKGAMNDTSQMFSVEMLMLDLNTLPKLSSIVTNIPSTGSITDSQFQDFMENYWAPLIQNGGVVFANSAQPVGASYPPSSIVPSAMNFIVSPYIPNSAEINTMTIEQKANLATLNYLVMSNSRSLPIPISPFNWNWVNNGENTPGIMSVRRDLLLDYLSSLLQPQIQALCMVFECDLREQSVTMSPCTGTQNFQSSRVQSYNSSLPMQAEPNNSTSNKGCLHFTYYTTASDTTIVSPIDGKLNISQYVYCDVYLIGNQIQCITSVYIYFDFEADWVSKTYGWPIASTHTAVFTLAGVGASPTAGNAGLLNVVAETPSDTNHTQTSNKSAAYYNGDMDPSLFAKIISFGCVNDLEADVQAIGDSLSKILTNGQSQIASFLAGSFGFVFPGAQTYTFLNPQFSDASDLTVQVSYQAI